MWCTETEWWPALQVGHSCAPPVESGRLAPPYKVVLYYEAPLRKTPVSYVAGTGLLDN